MFLFENNLCLFITAIHTKRDFQFYLTICFHQKQVFAKSVEHFNYFSYDFESNRHFYRVADRYYKQLQLQVNNYFMIQFEIFFINLT